MNVSLGRERMKNSCEQKLDVKSLELPNFNHFDFAHGQIMNKNITRVNTSRYYSGTFIYCDTSAQFVKCPIQASPTGM